MDKLHEHVERALARPLPLRPRPALHGQAEDDKIVIIDECTGRPMPDRHWREGLHQAVEAKEKVPITLAADHAAQITFQSLLPALQEAGGHDAARPCRTSGNCAGSTSCWVVCVPTNRPVIREHLPDRVFPTEDAKFDAVVAKCSGCSCRAGRC